MTTVRLNRDSLLIFIFLMCVSALCIFKIKDTDAWMHLSIGRYIWNLGGLPVNEPLVYTVPDTPFYYSSWLFSVIYYLAYRLFEAYGVILLKTATVAAAFFIILRDSLRPYRSLPVAVVVMTLIALASYYRFVERPDTFLMVFISFAVFSLNAYIYDNRKYLYLLPLVVMIWANCHSSVNLILAVFPSFLAGGLLQSLLVKRGLRFSAAPSGTQLRTILFVFFASLAASVLNPYFIKQLYYGAEVLSSPWATRNILELQKPVWPLNRTPYFLAAALLVSFALGWRRVSLMHLFLAIPFMVLPFTAKRFTFLLAVIAGPVIVRNIAGFLHEKSWNKAVSGRVAHAFAISWAAAFTGFMLIAGDPAGEQKRILGFGINESVVPEGALKYMDRKGITGRVFNLLNYGGYINWRDFPKRTVFVDPRFHIPVELLEKMEVAQKRSEVLDELERRFRFDSLLLAFPKLMGTSVMDNMFHDKDLYVSHPGWRLVYWDDTSLLYLKQGGRYDSDVNDDEYRFVRPVSFSPFNRTKLHDAGYRDNVLRELKRAFDTTGSVRAGIYLGELNAALGQDSKSIDILMKVADRPSGRIARVYAGIADAYRKLGQWENAAKYYDMTFKLSEDPAYLYKAGLACKGSGNLNRAEKYLQKAMAGGTGIVSIHKILADIYNESGRQADAERELDKYRKATDMEGRGGSLKSGYAAYRSRRYDTALSEFEKAASLDPSDPFAYAGQGSVFLDLGNSELAFEYFRTALLKDPLFPEALYGLGTVYLKWGDRENGARLYEDYLKIEPDGLYALRVLEALRPSAHQ